MNQKTVRMFVRQRSFTMVMLALAGAMALMLGIVGIYGVIAYAVTQRTREIGIRMALGAQPAGLQQMFVRHGLLLAGIGAGPGFGRSRGADTPDVNPAVRRQGSRSADLRWRRGDSNRGGRTGQLFSPHAAPPGSIPWTRYELSSLRLPLVAATNGESCAAGLAAGCSWCPLPVKRDSV